MSAIQQNIMGISNGKGYSFIELDHILFLKANSNYTEIHASDGRVYTAIRHLKYFEATIPSSAFIRIHHSYVVNMKHIVRYLTRDLQSVELKNGKRIPVSRSRKRRFIDSFIRV